MQTLTLKKRRTTSMYSEQQLLKGLAFLYSEPTPSSFSDEHRPARKILMHTLSIVRHGPLGSALRVVDINYLGYSTYFWMSTSNIGKWFRSVLPSERHIQAYQLSILRILNVMPEIIIKNHKSLKTHCLYYFRETGENT